MVPLIAQIAAIEEAFYNFDENNDGLITSTEFRKILDRLGEKERNSDVNVILHALHLGGPGPRRCMLQMVFQIGVLRLRESGSLTPFFYLRNRNHSPKIRVICNIRGS